MRLLLGSVFFVWSAFTFAQMDEGKVISDWELVQKDYPQTVDFRKVGEREYYLENTGFYTGKITIENIITEESDGYLKKTADIVVKLEVDDETLYKEKGFSYGRWTETNRLVYDENKDSWVRFKDLSYKKTTKKKKCSKPINKEKSIMERLFVAAFPMILFLVVFALTMRFANKSAKNTSNGLLESNLQIAQELKRIADLLEKRDS